MGTLSSIMRSILILAVLSVPLFGASEHCLQKIADKWVKRFDLTTLQLQVKKVSADFLFAVNGGNTGEYAYFGTSIYADRQMQIYVLDEKGYPAMEKIAGMKRMSGRQISADQRNTVVHELLHLMLILSRTDDDTDEAVVRTLTRWTGRGR